MIKIICKECKKEFKTFPCRIKVGRKFCSQKCSSKWISKNAKNLKIGKHPNSLKCLEPMTSKRAKKFGFGKWMTGKKQSKETKEKRRKAVADEKNGMWKGDDVGYHGLHKWVRRKLGQPKVCVSCGKGEKIEWANISYEYKRDLDDWIALCRKCHSDKDMKDGWGLASKKYPSMAYKRKVE